MSIDIATKLFIEENEKRAECALRNHDLKEFTDCINTNLIRLREKYNSMQGLRQEIETAIYFREREKRANYAIRHNDEVFFNECWDTSFDSEAWNKKWIESQEKAMYDLEHDEHLFDLDDEDKEIYEQYMKGIGIMDSTNKAKTTRDIVNLDDLCNSDNQEDLKDSKDTQDIFDLLPTTDNPHTERWMREQEESFKNLPEDPWNYWDEEDLLPPEEVPIRKHIDKPEFTFDDFLVE